VALSHQPFDLRRLATLGVGRVCVPAVDALLAETGALPDQIVDGTLQLGDAILEIADGRAGLHGSSLVDGGNIARRAAGRYCGRIAWSSNVAGGIYKFQLILGALLAIVANEKRERGNGRI
jgi:hypothetical protein